MSRVFALVILLLPLCGCSVVMALQGQKEPNVSVLEIGATRAQIELQLGPPVHSEPTDDGGALDTYEYVTGDEPSALRGVLHGFMDVLTLCLWELVGTPIEAVQGTTRTVQVEYDQNDYAAAIRRISASQAEELRQKREEQQK